MPQAIKVVRQTERQGLAGLHEQTPPRRSCGELALDGGKDSLDQGSPSILAAGEVAPHFRSHSAIR